MSNNADNRILKEILSGTTKVQHNVLGNQQLSALFDYFLRTLPGAIYYKDKDGIYLGVSDYLVVASGFRSPSEVIGKTDFDLFDEPQAKALREHDIKVMKEEKVLSVEEKITLPNGETQYFEVVKTPLKDTKGSVVGVIGNSVDITKRVEAENKLIIEKERAEQANKAKKLFIADMEHDLRTPCSGIAEMTKLLEQSETRSDRKEMLGYVAEASQRLLEILNGILEFDHVESGRLPILYDRFELKKVLDDILALETPYAKNKHLKIDVYIEEEIPQILIGDKFRFSRILINLLSNAIKFTHKGYVKVSAKLAKKVDDRNVLLEIVVKDTGIGIPKEKQQIIYERFTRLNPANQGIYEGSGLGLCIVRKFIEELDGEIDVNSIINKGSTFKCLLPFRLPLIESQESICSYSNKTIGNNLVSTNSKDLHFLLVEDDLLAQKITSSLLIQNFVTNLDIASNGEEALKLTSQNKYDLIFMDIGLPILSGIEVTRKIRESLDNLNKESVIIVLTAHDSIDAKDECLKAGMSDFLVKPLNVEKIQDIVQKWFAIQDFAENIQKIAKTESNAAEKNKEHIDFNLAKQLANADEHLALELLRLLVKELPEYKTTINKAYNAKDLERLTKITHKLNGSAGYCGTVKLKKYAKTLGQYANVNDYVKIKIYLDKLNKEIDAVIEASREFVNL